MRTIGLLLVVAFISTMMVNCQFVSSMSDEDLAASVRMAAHKSTSYGLKYAIDKKPEETAAIKEGASLAASLIRMHVLPVFSGASTEEVLRSALDEALKMLSDHLTPTIMSSLQLAINIASDQIQLPQNPAESLSARAKMALLAFFNGVVDGIDEVVLVQHGFVPSRMAAPTTTVLTWPTR